MKTPTNISKFCFCHCVVLLVCCSNAWSQDPHQDETVRAATSLYEALCNGDANYALQLLDDKITCNENCHGQHTGKFNVLENVLTSLKSTNNTVKLSDVSYNTMSDDQILVTGNYRSTIGKSQTFAHWWWFKDGKFIRLRHINDAAIFQN